MIIKIEEGTLKVITDVKDTVCVKKYDEKGNVTDEYGFEYSPARPGISESKFAANAKIDGKLAYITQVNTDDKDCKKDIRETFGKSLVRANRFESSATAIVRAQELEQARFEAELDILVNGTTAPTIQPTAPTIQPAYPEEVTADPVVPTTEE